MVAEKISKEIIQENFPVLRDMLEIVYNFNEQKRTSTKPQHCEISKH